ncbi:putative ABC transport system ATP-binding protein [bacterium A37T11]|nr:putative ABC transport system ATP-binding protein [bacterium A37T11]
MVRLQQISKRFHIGTPTQVIALQNIDLTINKGQFVVIVGANGSGKSTLLNTLAGNIPADQGKIWIDQDEVGHLPVYKRTRWIARVFQNPLSGTASELSILANFRLASLRRERKKMVLGITDKFREEVAANIQQLGMGLESKLDVPMGSLSGGQRQALTLLMAVMAKPALLLLDEPTAALDPHSARKLMELADRLICEHALTAILVTHNLNEALRYGNRLIQMQSGQIVRDLDMEVKNSLNQAEILAWFDYF